MQLAMATGVYQPANSATRVIFSPLAQQQQQQQQQQQPTSCNEVEFRLLRDEHAMAISFMCLIARRMHDISPISKVAYCIRVDVMRCSCRAGCSSRFV
jgi:hypothetical protein